MQTAVPETAGSPGHRKVKMKVDSENLAEFYKLHEERVQKLDRGKRQGHLSDRILEKSWGTRGSWLMIPQLPSGTYEEGHHLREVKILPRGEAYKDLASSMGLAVQNMKGDKEGDRTIGQDTFALARLPNAWEMFCVFDGHGQNGHWPAMRAAKTLPWFLQDESSTAMLDHGRPQAALMYAFEKVQSEMVAEALHENVDLYFCGCTALCILRHPKHDELTVATLGDTRTMMFVPGSGVIAETSDHKPTTAKERERVERMGCEVVEVAHDDDWSEARVSLQGVGYPGLAMTRSFGDCIVKDNGVVAEPECVVWKPSEHPGAMIFGASDGVWEFMKTQEVYELLTTQLGLGKTHQEVVNEVIQTAQSLWEENEEDYCDDITAVLVPLTGAYSVASTKGPAPASCCEGIQESCTLM